MKTIKLTLLTLAVMNPLSAMEEQHPSANNNNDSAASSAPTPMDVEEAFNRDNAFANLPDEVILHIAEYLIGNIAHVKDLREQPVQAFYRLKQTCSKFNTILTDESLKPAIQQSFQSALQNCSIPLNLLKAVDEEQPLPIIKALIYAGADLNKQDKNRNTALIISAFKGNEKIAQALLAAGADLNMQTKDGETALIAAARVNNLEGHVKIALALIDSSADLDKQNISGQTALARASLHNTKIAPALIKAGANLDLQDKDGWTALMAAAAFACAEIAQALIDAGADLDKQSITGETALLLTAVHTKRTETITPPSDAINKATIEEPRRGYTRIATVLLKAGADPNLPDKHGSTPLLMAARNGHTKLAQALLRAGAELKAEDNEGRTALAIARKKDHTNIVRLLEQAEKDQAAQSVQH